MAAFVPVLTDDLPTLIVNGDVKKAEITLAPRLDVDGVAVGLNAVTQTFDLGAGTFVDDYFKGANAVVDTAKCNVCHDQLAVTFHTGRGRGGDIVACKNCHAPVFTGSHVEMASRSIENYVHAIHSFQDFDPGDTFETFDPVFAARYDEHINHTFPNFTIKNCEACHNPGTYNVPDQSKSLPGVLSASDDPATWYEMVGGLAVEDTAGRNISGSVPEYVTGPASRACGGCHRADLINADRVGDLAAFNAHTEAGGTFVENDAEDTILYGIIDKIMSLFE
jgi:OmcA/MtrC family decaheme c-type cytochrome